MPEWLIQTVLAIAVSVIGWIVGRAVGAIEKVDQKVENVEGTLNDFKLFAAQNYVTHDELKELKRDQRRTLHALAQLQAQLAAVAARLNVRLPEANDDGEQ